MNCTRMLDECVVKSWILTSITCKSLCSMSGKTDYIGVTNIEILDQGHLHLLLEDPSNQDHSSLAKSYLNSLLIAIRNIHMSSRHYNTYTVIHCTCFTHGVHTYNCQLCVRSVGWSNSKLQTSTWFPPQLGLAGRGTGEGVGKTEPVFQFEKKKVLQLSWLLIF